MYRTRHCCFVVHFVFPNVISSSFVHNVRVLMSHKPVIIIKSMHNTMICIFQNWKLVHFWLKKSCNCHTIKIHVYSKNILLQHEMLLRFLSPPVLMHNGLLCITVCLSVCGKNARRSIHISETRWPTITKFGHKMEKDNP